MATPENLSSSIALSSYSLCHALLDVFNHMYIVNHNIDCAS